MKNHTTRRTFLRQSAALTSGSLLLPTVLTSCSNWKGANDRIVVGHIGVGSRGTDELMNYFLPLPEALNIAVCDVFRERRETVAQKINAFYKENNFTREDCKTYLEMDELLARPDIDAVHITTPDHWHVPAAIRAARAGKHIMLAKPLGLSYPQNILLANELKTHGLKFHYGTQQRTLEHIRMAKEMIQGGAIGEIHRVEVWAPGKNDVPNPPLAEEPVPDGFDYDRWSGPAPLRPYCAARVTNNGSWFNYDYSIGFLGGWGAHPLDILVWILREQVKGAYSCEGSGKFWEPGGLYNNILSWDLRLCYTTGLLVRFMSGDVANETILKNKKVKETNGTTFYGTKGYISVSRSAVESDIPELHVKLNSVPKQANGRVKGENNTMGRRFISIVRGKEPELCPLADAILSDTISHMGDMAIRTGRKVIWDPVLGEVQGDAEANQLYQRNFRAPYQV
ncbi:MAG: Gfo/Idh/MocA family oxidoreductase [Marinilabiliales bacterium]|nr:Gfo/Idh/MocA family oxidoreductase [Marinilabiliales bacterium]